MRLSKSFGISISLCSIFVAVIAGCPEPSAPQAPAFQSLADIAISDARRREKDLQNQLAIERAPRRTVVTLTPQAVERIGVMQTENPRPFLRISAKLEGPSETSFDLDVEDQLDPENDILHIADKLIIAVDQQSVLHVEGCTVDWVRTDTSVGFVFEKPNSLKN